LGQLPNTVEDKSGGAGFEYLTGGYSTKTQGAKIILMVIMRLFSRMNP
jgi:hypothetical protein